MLLTNVICNSRNTRNDTPEQQWYIQAGTTHVQLAGTTLCIDGGAESGDHGDLHKVTAD